jgi:hypothetical protein
MAILTIEEVQEYIRDFAENNHLLDGQEFTPTVIKMAINLCISEWNTIPPLSSATEDSFPFAAKSILMSGTIWKLFAGQAALLARNTMNYSDGGIQIPVEERAALYLQIAELYAQSFMTAAQRLKIHLNMEDGWGYVLSDESAFPLW